MTLPYTRTVEHLSPSSLRQLEEDPMQFYLRRLGPQETAPKDDEQGFPSSVGCAFDAAVKCLLSATVGVKAPPLLELQKSVVHDRQQAIDLGNRLLLGYAESGALKALIREGIHSVENHPEIRFAPGTKVPIKGFLDATLQKSRKATLVVHDWKTTGANFAHWDEKQRSKSVASPRPGYVRIFDTHKGEGKPHKKAGCYFEEIDEAWATQVTIYGWLLGHPVRERNASIDEIIICGGDRFRVAQFRAVVSVPFQHRIRARLVKAWHQIQTNAVVPEALANLSGHELAAMR